MKTFRVQDDVIRGQNNQYRIIEPLSGQVCRQGNRGRRIAALGF